MEDVKNYFKKNICIFCDNKNKEYCMNIQEIKKNNIIQHKCLNFIKKQEDRQEKVFSKFIKFEYLNEYNKYVVIVIKNTPKTIIEQLKLKYDEVEIQSDNNDAR